MIYVLAVLFMQLHITIGQNVMTANFQNPASQTGIRSYINFVGLTMNLSEVGPYLNTTLLQGYLLNSGIKGSWQNVFAAVLRMPKGWFYECSNGGYSSSDITNCKKQLKTDTTFFNQLGQFSVNSFNSPYWTFGFNNEMINFANAVTQASLYNFFINLFTANSYTDFMIEMMFQGDKAIENGMRGGTSYTSAMFISESYYYQQILYGITYKAPGISEYATQDWMGSISSFFYNVWYGVFTFQSIIFTDPTLATIQNLLSDNYTRGYLQRRGKVNSTLSYNDFSSIWASLSRIRLVPGQGIDGITNTFAAAIWWVDFVIESSIFMLFDISIQGASREGNYQSVFGPPPNFTPTSLYYGTIFALIAIDSQPQIIIPNYITGTSTKIKVWGLKLLSQMRYLILNKDTNSSLNGTINIIPKQKSARIRCIYMQAPSLTSKAENMKIGGHTFIGGNFTPQGLFQKTYVLFDSNINGFPVPIKYAQVAICQTQVFQTAQNSIPTRKTSVKNQLSINYNMLMFILLTILLIVK